MKRSLKICMFQLIFLVPSNALSQEAWVPENCLIMARDQFTGGVIGGKIYVFGGNRNYDNYNLKSTEMFDPSNHLWTLKANNENFSGHGVEELTGAVIDEKLYVFGGFLGSVISFVEEYDPVTDIWSSKAPGPTARTGIAVPYDGEIYVFGGSGPEVDGIRPLLDVVEAYNPLTDSWRELISMPRPLQNFEIAVFNDKAYIVGGGTSINGQKTFNSEIMVFDFLNNQWVDMDLPPIPTPRVFSYAGASPVIEDKMYCIGGLEASSSPEGVSLSSKVDVFDFTTETWSAGPSLPEPLFLQLTVTIDKTIYVIGGNTITSESVDLHTAAVWKLDLSEESLDF